MTKRLRSVTLLVCTLVVALPAAAGAGSAGGGTVSGSIDEFVSPPYGPDDPVIESQISIVARDAAGTAHGTLTYGKPTHDDARRMEHIPFTIAGLPLGTPLVVSAGPHGSALPSPVPTGFFMTFNVVKEHGTSPPAGYAVTLTPAAPHAVDVDFMYEALEVVPRPPGTPAPVTSPA